MRSTKGPLTYKIAMYVNQLLLLFVIVAIYNVNLDFKLSDNIITVIALIFTSISFACGMVLRYWSKGSKDLPVEIVNLGSQNYDYILFFAICAILSVILNFSLFYLDCAPNSQVKYAIILSVLIILLGIIVIRSGFYYANPIFALFGYKLYSIEYKNKDEIRHAIVITEDDLAKGDLVKSIRLEKSVWYVRKDNTNG